MVNGLLDTAAAVLSANCPANRTQIAFVSLNCSTIIVLPWSLFLISPNSGSSIYSGLLCGTKLQELYRHQLVSCLYMYTLHLCIASKTEKQIKSMNQHCRAYTREWPCFRPLTAVVPMVYRSLSVSSPPSLSFTSSTGRCLQSSWSLCSGSNGPPARWKDRTWKWGATSDNSFSVQ